MSTLLLKYFQKREKLSSGQTAISKVFSVHKKVEFVFIQVVSKALWLQELFICNKYFNKCIKGDIYSGKYVWRYPHWSFKSNPFAIPSSVRALLISVPTRSKLANRKRLPEVEEAMSNYLFMALFGCQLFSDVSVLIRVPVYADDRQQERRAFFNLLLRFLLLRVKLLSTARYD